MRHFTHKQGHARDVVRKMQLPLHFTGRGNGKLKGRLNLVTLQLKVLQFPFYTHKKAPFIAVGMLVEGNNVAVVSVDKIGYPCHNAPLVGAMNADYGGFAVILAHFIAQKLKNVCKNTENNWSV